VSAALQHGWILLIYPIIVVGMGLDVGSLVSRVLKVPADLRPSILAAIAFGNTTGLPLTLLTTIHQSFPSTTELGAIDPIIFLSVYLLVYPILQWGVGTALLNDDGAKSTASLSSLPGGKALGEEQQSFSSLILALFVIRFARRRNSGSRFFATARVSHNDVPFAS